MRIGLISDTHCRGLGSRIPADALRALAGVELILHAGDLTTRLAIDQLESIAPVLAVRGNCDPGRLPERRLVERGGVRIAMVHVPPLTCSRLVLGPVFGGEPDVLVCGHTHRALLEDGEGLLVVNPGSPTQPRGGERTVAMLTIEETVSAHLIPLGPAPQGD